MKIKFLWTIAGKNLFRNKLRTIVSIIAIAISVATVVFARGLITGMIDSMFSTYIKNDTGHIKIINEEYRQKQKLLSLAYPVDGFEGEGISSMLSELKEVDGIERVLPRIKFGAMSSVGDEMVAMLGWGIDPVREKGFLGLEDKLVEGKMIRPGERGLVLGRGLLQKLKKRVGERVTILYTTSFNSFKGTTFKISGVIESELPIFNDRVFYLPLDVAQDILVMPDRATELLLITPNAEEAEEYYPAVRDLFQAKDSLDRYSVSVWNKANPLLQYMDVAVRIYDVIYVFLVLLSSIVVINTMIMIVKERTQEIGMMTALGLKSGDILKLFVIEGTIMGIIGSFIGAILGGFITKLASVHGLDYGKEAFEALSEDIMMNPVIYPSFSYEHMIFAFILGIIITSLTCIYPARRAARLEPYQALRDI